MGGLKRGGRGGEKDSKELCLYINKFNILCVRMCLPVCMCVYVCICVCECVSVSQASC